MQSEIIDQLGGWSSRSVGQNYGNGFDLMSTFKIMAKNLNQNSSMRRTPTTSPSIKKALSE